MIKEVIEGLKIVADGVKSVQDIAEAVKTGKDYVKARHVEVQSDLRLMVDELGKNLFVIKRASAVLTNFRFAVSSDGSGSELARFNDYFIHSKTETQYLQEHINDLRTHCSKIRKHGIKISGSATADGFARIFNLLGLNSPEKEKELGEQLDKLAYEDFAVANSAEKMLECLIKALGDVQNALGEGGLMHPEKVPDAAALLNEYGSVFEKMEEQSTIAVKNIQEVVEALR
jgi:hypothetical protein